MNTKKYKVLVYDNFEYPPEPKIGGEYDTELEAINHCKGTIEHSIREGFSEEKSANDLYSWWSAFGYQPYITNSDFFANDYAREYCSKIETLLGKAVAIAESAHKGQKDKAGADYILHPLRVMEKGETEIEKICGVLHDVVEDSDWTFEALKKEGFTKKVITVLRCLTKETENEDYNKFIKRVAKNPVAIQVKINDLLDNMDITRFKQLNESDLKRLNKYLNAYWRLRKIQEKN